MEFFDTIAGTHLQWSQWLVLAFSAILIGINKTAVPGLGIMPVVMLTLFFETRMSTGLQLGMIALADLIAVAYYRRNADWKLILRLLPWALTGILAGVVILRLLPADGAAMRRTIGIVVLLMVVLSVVKRKINPEKIPDGIGYSAFFGISMGTTTQIANAAGPISSIYLLSMRLPKEKYMGCCAWFFLTLNWLKLPIFVAEGRVTWQSVKLDLCMIPLLLLGGFIGIVLLKKMPQKLFESIIQILVVAAAIKLLM